MSDMNKLNVIAYHANCIDGFTSAWVAHKALDNKANNETCYIPMDYSEASEVNLIEQLKSPPWGVGITEIKLYVLDFSLSLDCLSKIQDQLPEVSVQILDHHKTAFEKYAGWAPSDSKDIWQGNVEGAHVYLDNKLSGAGLAWQYFFPAEPAPWLVKYVQDYDLWKFAQGDNTRAINMWLKNIPREFKSWDEAYQILSSVVGESTTLDIGYELLAEHIELVKSYAAKAVPCSLNVHSSLPAEAYIVQAPYELASDVGHAICKEHNTFAVIINFDMKELKINVSLRSEGDLDVSAVAKFYGGGGHKNAAGFKAYSLADFLTEVYV